MPAQPIDLTHGRLRSGFRAPAFLELIEGLERRFGAELIRVDPVEGLAQLVAFWRGDRGRRLRQQGRKERQVVDHFLDGRGALSRFQLAEKMAGALDNGGRQARQFGDLNAIGTVGCALHHFMQEDDIAIPFGHTHGEIHQARQSFRQLRELVEMGCKQSARAIAVVQMFNRRPGDGQAIECRRAATDLVENDKRMLGRLVENGRRLDHFNHEGGASARQIVSRTNAREETIDNADMGLARRHISAHLRKHDNQRVLAQIGRFTRHIRTGDDGNARRLAAGICQIRIIGDKALPLGAQGCFHHGVTACNNFERERGIDDRAHPIAQSRNLCQRCADIDGSQRIGCLFQKISGAQDLIGEAIENGQFERNGTIGSRGDLGLDLVELIC